VPTYECSCGAKYRFSQAHVGKRGKCKKCNAVFTLIDENAPIPVADEPELTVSVRIDSTTARQAGVAQSMLPPGGAPSSVGSSDGELDALTERGPGGYFRDLFWSFLFATYPRDLTIFLIFGAVLALGDGFFGFAASGTVLFAGGLFLGAFLFLMWLVFKGWFAGVRFAIVESAAAGDQHLPDYNVTADWFDDYLVPAFQWFFSWVIVLIPAGVYMIYYASNHPVGVMVSVGLDNTAPVATPTVFEQIPFLILAGAGLFVWPMVILCVALGGLSTIVRFDLLLISIVRTLPVYLLTVAIVYAAEGGGVMLRGIIYDAIAPPSLSGGSAPFGQRVMAAGAGDAAYLYLSIVMLRAIGLYYYHFNRRFAWNWG